MFGVKSAGDILRLFQFYELTQEFSKAVDRIGRRAVWRAKIRNGEEGTVDGVCTIDHDETRAVG